MSRFATGNIFLVASMISTTASHLLLKALLDELPAAGPVALIRELLTVERFPRAALAGVLAGSGFLLWLLCLMRLPLSYAYPVASVSVLLVALFSVVVLGETMNPRMWIGTVLIFVGIALLRPEGAG